MHIGKMRCFIVFLDKMKEDIENKKMLHNDMNESWCCVINEEWKKTEPRVSIITPVYNRRMELPRALDSVKNQTYRNFEHIIIDDGSVINIDDIVDAYMKTVPFPVAYIKKPNGGVHTARNAGIKISRGKLIIPLDSDDELKPDCLKVLTEAWDKIPAEKIHEYWQVTAFCENHKGVRIGGHLPDGINQLPFNEAKYKAKSVEKGEKIGMLRGDLMRALPWPEPEGVNFVSEAVNWLRLDSQYLTWFVDDVVRIYHTDTENSLSNDGVKRDNQKLINMLYDRLWLVNNGGKFGQSNWMIIKNILWYCMLWHLLHWRRSYPNYIWVRKGIVNYQHRAFSYLLWLPAIFPAFLYQCKHS